MDVDEQPQFRKCGVDLPPGALTVWSNRTIGWEGGLKITGKMKPYPHWLVEPDELSVN